MVVAGVGPAFPLLALARVRVHRGPPGHGSGWRVRRLLRRHRVLRRGADWGEVTVVVVVGHGHVMHVAAAIAVVVAVVERE